MELQIILFSGCKSDFRISVTSTLQLYSLGIMWGIQLCWEPCWKISAGVSVAVLQSKCLLSFYWSCQRWDVQMLTAFCSSALGFVLQFEWLGLLPAIQYNINNCFPGLTWILYDCYIVDFSVEAECISCWSQKTACKQIRVYFYCHNLHWGALLCFLRLFAVRDLTICRFFCLCCVSEWSPCLAPRATCQCCRGLNNVLCT